MKIKLKIRKTLIYIIVGSFLFGLAVSLVINSYKNAHSSLKYGLALLKDSNIDEAGELFAQLTSSLWVKKKALLGHAITCIIKGNQCKEAVLPSPSQVDIQNFHLQPLIRKQFLECSFSKCIKLSKIGKYYGIDAAGLYLAAALLETGKTKEAYSIFSRLAPGLRNSSLGTRLKEAYELLSLGVKKIIRDRRGKILGLVSIEGAFEFYRHRYSRLIQPVVLRQILNSTMKKGCRLSIDLEMSALALESLEGSGNKGSIVLIKPETGEILAAVSDQKTIKKMGAVSSPAFEQMLEPASILKLITVVAAFRNNLDPEQEIKGQKCRGARRYNGKFLYCPSVRGRVRGLSHALATSCNIMFADLGVKLGWEKMLKELHLFGFNSVKKNPFPLGKIIIPKGDDRALADLSIGLENTVISPVHAALTASVFANKGFWVEPEFIHAGDGFTGFTPELITRSRGKRLIENEWFPAIYRAMNAVSRYGGTAAYVAPFAFPVRMKTGTGGTYRDGFHINYIGNTISTKGNVAFCVRVTGKRTSRHIRRAGYGVNRALLLKLKQLASKRGGKLY
ncbi:MAG: hypothetical protein GY757_21840 [bacterium]|nr:hypothetical protein [bacterium]